MANPCRVEVESRVVYDCRRSSARYASPCDACREVGPCDPCTCRERCGDTTDELGTCKGLPAPAKTPLIEFIVVHRDDLRRAPTERTERADG